MNTIAWWLLAAALVLTGIAGTILPVLPGTLLVLGGLTLGAWIDAFSKVGWLPLLGITVLALLAWMADYAAAVLGARRAKASSLALWGAAIGTLLGLLGGVAGVLLAPLIGAALGEWIARSFYARPGTDASRTGALEGAVRVGFATGVALILAMAFKLAATFAMLGIFALAYFW